MIMGAVVGIYKIISPTGKVYIGQSRNILIRWRDHKRSKTAKGKLFYLFKKYGATAHIFSIIHELPTDIDNETLTIYEQLYIDLYRACSLKRKNKNDNS